MLKRQGKWPEDYALSPPGAAMAEYLRDGEKDREVAVQRGGRRPAELLRAVVESASTLGKSMPTFGECEDAIRDFDDELGLTKKGHR